MSGIRRALRSNALRFPVLGAAFVFLGLQHRPAGWLLVWFGVSFACVGMAYALNAPSFFGKRADGKRAWWSWLPYGPHFLFSWLSWQAARFFGGEPCCHEIASGVWLGRRPYADELPGEIGLVVDLTSEFPVAAGVSEKRKYLCLPILDGAVADPARFARMIEEIFNWTGGPVYIHCALGHGRSGMLAAAVLVRKGLSQDPEAAVRALQRVRPHVGLNEAQMDFLKAACRKMIP